MIFIRRPGHEPQRDPGRGVRDGPLIDQHIVRPLPMHDGIRGRRIQLIVVGPFEIEAIVARRGYWRLPRGRTGGRVHRHHGDGIGRHRAIALRGEFHPMVLSRSQGHGCQMMPVRAPGRLLIAHHRRAAVGMVDGIRGIGRPIPIFIPPGIHMIGLGLGHRQRPGKGIGRRGRGIPPPDRGVGVPEARPRGIRAIGRHDKRRGRKGLFRVEKIITAVIIRIGRGGRPRAGSTEGRIRVVSDERTCRQTLGRMREEVDLIALRRPIGRPGIDHGKARILIIDDDLKMMWCVKV